MKSNSLVKIPDIRRYSHCKVCGKILRGRTDKKYCKLECKNQYHLLMRKVNLTNTLRTDRFLHRNRVVLIELFEGVKTKKIFVPKTVMLKMGFKFEFFNSIYKNRQGKLYYYIYDFRWMPFSSQEILIVRA